MKPSHEKAYIQVKTQLNAGGNGSGLGDTIANFTHAIGLDKLADWYTETTGQDCGCKERQEALNNLFPTL